MTNGQEAPRLHLFEPDSPDAQIEAGDPVRGEPTEAAPAPTDPSATVWTDAMDLGQCAPGTLRLLLGQFSPLYTGPSTAGRIRLQRAGALPPVVPELAGISLNATVVSAGTSTGGFVTLAKAATAPVVVTLSVNSSALQVAPSATVPAGAQGI